jgi:hypothetical protein
MAGTFRYTTASDYSDANSAEVKDISGNPFANQFQNGSSYWVGTRTDFQTNNTENGFYLGYIDGNEHFSARLAVNPGSSFLRADTGGFRFDFSGESANVRFVGGLFGDVLVGGVGNDTLTGGGGNDALDGGNGTDVAQFTGNRADYAITYVSDHILRVADSRAGAPNGTDDVSNVETFHFADGDRTYSDLVSDPSVNTQPTVASIVRAAGAAATVPPAGTSVSYTVTFNEAVTGVDGSDFALTTTGSAHGNVASVAGSGTTYNVVVDGLSGDGTLRLDLNSSGTGISDSATAPISGGYTGGATFTLDHPTPTPQPPVTQGTAGDVVIAAGTLTAPIYGGAGAESITSTPLAGTTAHLYGGNGFADPNDAGDTISISGGGAADVYGNGGDDIIVFTATGVANVFGGVGDDRITVTNDTGNTVTGGPGADTITITGNGSNLVVGGIAINDPNDGADTIRITGNGSNIVYANGGDDRIVIAGSGNNTVYGGVGNDTITGGSGNDVIVGGPGANVYTGGGGADQFVHAAGAQDIVTDFSFAQGDRLDLAGQAYTLTTTSDGNAALLFSNSGVIVLQGVTEAAFQSGFVV